MHTASIAVLIIGLLHFGIAFAEIFLWNRLPIYQRLALAPLTPEQAKAAAPIVRNAGLYNAFIASGLVWGACGSAGVEAFRLQLFFLGCVFVAGVVGGLTLSRNTFLIQSAPALIAAILVWRAHL